MTQTRSCSRGKSSLLHVYLSSKLSTKENVKNGTMLCLHEDPQGRNHLVLGMDKDQRQKTRGMLKTVSLPGFLFSRK
ncbi:MAG: hypothetical protein CM15mV135_310 [uncultured marine virus]|nr:MAG: hypothetical protein CM15mV135_310 [uncultured marine virus]